MNVQERLRWLDLDPVVTPEVYEQLEDQVLKETEDHLSPVMAFNLRALKLALIEWRSEGIYLYSPTGEAFFDCLGAGGVFGLGFRHPKVVEAVKRQLDMHTLSTRMGLCPATTSLARMLSERAPGKLKQVWFGNSGTEALEAALKLARLTTQRPALVGTHFGYHGMSIATLSISGLRLWRDGTEPPVGSTRLVPFGDMEAMHQAVDNRTAAVILEPVQWASGCEVAPPGYLQAVRDLCNERGALLILDEVQTGLGRTGALWACDHWNVVPDILCIGKILSGGVMPISATLYNDRVRMAELPRPLFNNSSFGGNPLACAAGVATLEVLEEEGLIERSRILGERVGQAFDDFIKEFPEVVAGQRGMGLMRCLQTTEPAYGSYLQDLMRKEHKIFVASMLHMPQFVRISPPFICTDADLERMIEGLRTSLARIRDVGMPGVQAYYQSIHQQLAKAQGLQVTGG